MELLELSRSSSVQATGRYRNMKTRYPDRTVLADPPPAPIALCLVDAWSCQGMNVNDSSHITSVLLSV